MPVALVTGAANGIGRATTEHLRRAGWSVAAFDIEPDSAVEYLDVTDEEQWREAVAGLERLDLLVNNAGLLSSGAFTQTPGTRHRAIVEVNLLGVINGALAGFDLLARTPRSVMVNLASASAMYGQPDLATYSATKFAIRGLTEALDLEWAEHDIRVIDLWPMFVQTQMVEGIHATSGDRLGIRLTPDDVAVALLAAVNGLRDKPARSHLRNPHVPVGRQARILTPLAQISPHWANRLLTKIVTNR
jgi:NAD(P)-dependent dehydrogenase (short-subunit alcohol dehydrogenase family)